MHIRPNRLADVTNNSQTNFQFSLLSKITNADNTKGNIKNLKTNISMLHVT